METDADFAGDVDTAGGKPFPGVFRIVYVDASGDRTERTIERCSRVAGPFHSYVLAWCRLREAERLFRVDRVQQVADAGTGEIIDAFELGTGFAPEPRPFPGAVRLDDPLRAALPDLDVLTFVASLSSKMRDSQLPVIAAYLVAHAGAAAGPDLDRQIRRHRVPGPEAMRQSMKAIPRGRADALLEACAAVLAAVKRAGDLDRGVLAMLEKRKALIGNNAGDRE